MENRPIVRIPADPRLKHGPMVRFGCPREAGGQRPVCRTSSGGAIRTRLLGGSPRFDGTKARRASTPSRDEARLPTASCMPSIPRVFPIPTATGGLQFDQFGSQHAGGKSSPIPLRRMVRQSSGTTPWAGVSPNPLPAHGETLGDRHCARRRPLSHCHCLTGICEFHFRTARR